MYNLKTGQWIKRAPLPARLGGGHLVTFEGLPTFVGGYDDDKHKSSDTLYQYNWEQDEWIMHPTLKLKIPRYEAAVFTVPKDLINVC